MKRETFLKNICGAGVCSCLGVGMLFNGTIEAKGDGFSDSKDCEWKKNFIQKRFNWL